MIGHVNRIEWDNIGEAIPALLTIILMPMTYSVACASGRRRVPGSPTLHAAYHAARTPACSTQPTRLPSTTTFLQTA